MDAVVEEEEEEEVSSRSSCFHMACESQEEDEAEVLGVFYCKREHFRETGAEVDLITWEDDESEREKVEVRPTIDTDKGVLNIVWCGLCPPCQNFYSHHTLFVVVCICVCVSVVQGLYESVYILTSAGECGVGLTVPLTQAICYGGQGKTTEGSVVSHGEEGSQESAAEELVRMKCGCTLDQLESHSGLWRCPCASQSRGRRDPNLPVSAKP